MITFTNTSTLFITLNVAIFISFIFNDTATTELYTLSLHDALPISAREPALPRRGGGQRRRLRSRAGRARRLLREDRKSTRLNSSHVAISYAVFCLKKKKNECGVSSIS